MNLSEFEQSHSFKMIDTWTPELIKDAAKIYEQGLGQKYISEEDLIIFAGGKEKYILIGALIDDELAGVMLAYPMSQDESEEYDRELLEKNVPKILSSRKVGIIKSVAVEKNYRRRGLGTQLIIRSMQKLEEMGCDLFFAVSWDSGLKDSSPSIFKALGFTKALEISEYWKEDSRDLVTNEPKYMCPVDGNPCRCSAIFFFKNPL